jgi:hypothetical protein
LRIVWDNRCAELVSTPQHRRPSSQIKTALGFVWLVTLVAPLFEQRQHVAFKTDRLL